MSVTSKIAKLWLQQPVFAQYTTFNGNQLLSPLHKSDETIACVTKLGSVHVETRKEIISVGNTHCFTAFSMAKCKDFPTLLCSAPTLNQFSYFKTHSHGQKPKNKVQQNQNVFQCPKRFI